MKKQIIMGTAIASALAMVAPVSVFAASTLKNSIGSVDMTDNGTTVGVDETQTKKTEYYDSTTDATKHIIEADATKECQVYATQASTFSVVIPKTVILNGAKGADNSGTYVVTVKGNVAGNETVSVVPTASFKMKQANKTDIDATVAQAVTKFKVKDSKPSTAPADTVYGIDETAGSTTTGKITVTNLSAGSWNGQFNFTIALNADS